MSTLSPRPQSFQNHRAIPPLYYLLAGVVLLVEFGHQAWLAFHAPSFWSLWSVLGAAALLAVWFASRRCAQIVQDRVIRLEMQLRLERLLGTARGPDFERLQLPQRIALRFAGDEELPKLLERILAGQLTAPDDIKREVRSWQADWLRV